MGEWVSIGFMLGTLVCIIFFSAGVIIGDKREHSDDSDVRIYVPNGNRDRSRNNRPDISDEELAAMLRAICVTGICPSRNEKEYLQEAAERLEKRIEDDGR